MLAAVLLVDKGYIVSKKKKSTAVALRLEMQTFIFHLLGTLRTFFHTLHWKHPCTRCMIKPGLCTVAVYMWSMLGSKSLHNDVTCNPIYLGRKRFVIELQLVNAVGNENVVDYKGKGCI